MKTRRARILVIDDARGTLGALDPVLTQHDVETANDAVQALYQIDCATGRPFDLIFCDLARGDVPGPELWAYLSLTRKSAAKRMVFVASGPLSAQTRAFLSRVPNVCIELPLDAEALDMLAASGASHAGGLLPEAASA